MSGNKPQITLMVPALGALSPQQWRELGGQLPALPGLSELFNRLQRISSEPKDFESALGKKFGWVSNSALPVAALTYWYDMGRPPDDYVLRADPIYLKVDRDCLLLLGRHSLHLTRKEADQLVEQINRVYPDTSWSLEVGSEDRWYICSEEDFAITTSNINEAFGKNIARHLPRGVAEKKWLAVLNELQMLLYNSEINIARETQRQLPINSLWLWGEGWLPEHPGNQQCRFAKVWSNDALCVGLARWAQCAFESLPTLADRLIENIQPGHHLLVLDDLRLLAREDFTAWENRLLQWEDSWFKPLSDSVKTHQVQLRIETGTGLVFEKPRALWNRWWGGSHQWYQWMY